MRRRRGSLGLPSGRTDRAHEGSWSQERIRSLVPSRPASRRAAWSLRMPGGVGTGLGRAASLNRSPSRAAPVSFPNSARRRLPGPARAGIPSSANRGSPASSQVRCSSTPPTVRRAGSAVSPSRPRSSRRVASLGLAAGPLAHGPGNRAAVGTAAELRGGRHDRGHREQEAASHDETHSQRVTGLPPAGVLVRPCLRCAPSIRRPRPRGNDP